MIVVDPRGLTPRDWCDYTGDNLVQFVGIMKIDRDDQWKDWGMHALNVLRRRGYSIPDPAFYVSFEEWAMRFNQLIQNL